ncbi:MAG: hypothetical protein OXG33_00795 [Chloroflexi bacterium]|nr:hypothetical protein [Chloroflexota bacterium]
MALTERQARELRSLAASWNRASMAVGNLLRDGAVAADGIDMEVLRDAIDRRAQAEHLLISFWISVASDQSGDV